jgi:hypothetical protein
MKKIKISLNFLLKMIILFSMSFNIPASVADVVDKPLYQTPYFSKLEEFVFKISKHDSRINEHLNNITNIAVTAFLREHPKHIPLILNKFNNYPEEVKLIFANALIAVEGINVLDRLQYCLPTQNKPLSIIEVDKINLINLQKKEFSMEMRGSTDYLWAAFEGTGDKKYLINILAFLSSEPLAIKDYASELLNRDALFKALQGVVPDSDIVKDRQSSLLGYKDLQQGIKKLSEKDPKYSWEKVIYYSAALWSMEAQRKQNPDIEAKVVQILKKNPELDYRKK